MSSTSGKKKKILIGLSGRRDSAVAAYILKKQGHECVGVSFLFGDEQIHQKAEQKLNENLEKTPDKEYITQLGFDPKRFSQKPVRSRCHIQDLNPIKEFCDWMNIPFYAVKAQKLFRENVMETVVASRLLGRNHNPCLDCQALKVRLLLEKADLLGIDYVATGHYAKVFHHQQTGEHSLLASNDTENDQSFQLARLDDGSLERLILPLSEMRKTEVDRISRLIHTEVSESAKSQDPCFVGDRRFSLYVEAQAAPSLLHDGVVSDYKTEEVMGDHYGIHHFWVGQEKIKLHPERSLDPHLAVTEIQDATGTIFLANAREISYRYISVFYMDVAESQDFSKPIDLQCTFGKHDQTYPCRLYFKNSKTALVEFTEKYSNLIPPGSAVAFYNRPGVSARMIASGYVKSCGMFREDGSLNPHPLREDEQNREGVSLSELKKFDFKF